MALADDAKIVANEKVVSRIMDGEALLLSLDAGTYFGLNEVASSVWEMLAEGATVAALEAHVLQTYDIDKTTARRDLEELISELSRRGLVSVTA